MKIIIPMAGRGSRLRPHTLTVPKPLVPIAGKPIVQRLCEDIVDLYDGKVEEIAFIIGDFGTEVEEQLQEIARELGARGHIFHQETPEGTAHAIWMARECLDGEVIIAFADTLFRANFKIDRNKDGAIWVNKVDDPSSFGVVTVNEEGNIAGMVEKPAEFVSDLAIIGIYYIREGEKIREEIRYLIDNDLREKGEYQLTNALESMRQKGARFAPGEVDDWMDCGNKDAVLDTTKKILSYDQQDNKPLIASDVQQENSVVIEPCYIGKGVRLKNSVIGPFTVIADNTEVHGSVLEEVIVGADSVINHTNAFQSMIGNKSEVSYARQNLSIGDFSKVNYNA